MNRRLLPLALITAPALFAYACSSSSSNDNPTPTPEASTPDTSTTAFEAGDASMPDTSKADTSVPSDNPIDGVPAATVIINNVYFEGPAWAVDGLYMAAYLQPAKLLKYTPGAALSLTNPLELRDVVTAGSYILGSTLDEKSAPNTLVSLEVNNGAAGAQIVRTPLTGVAPRTGTPIALTFDAGGLMFDSPNDLVVRKTDGTIYMTDPGYQTPDLSIVTNHLWRIKPTTGDVFEVQLDGRPNGIALSPDNATLYVSFTSPAGGPPAPSPTVMKYTLALDGFIGAGTKFADVPPVTSQADGLAVDTAGNVYVAVANGVDVFKKDGTAKWGHINTNNKLVNGLAFGGADKKTLFMTSDTGLLSVGVKIAGLAQ